MSKNKYFKLLFLALFLGSIFSVSNVDAQENNAKTKNTGVQKMVITLMVGQEGSIWCDSDNKNSIQKYYSKDFRIAYVDNNGNVLAKMVGVTSIVSKNENNEEIETIVIVYRKRLEPLSNEEPRYILDKDGIYRDSKSEENINSNKARIMLVGDLMNQTRQQEAALTEDGTYNFNASFSLVKNIFNQADYVVGNIESLLSNSAPYMKEMNYAGGKPYCNGPSTYLDALRYAGFDTLITGNNHMLDYGEIGLLQTHEVIDKYKFSHTGTFTSKEEQRYVITEINGIKVAVLSYSEKFNGKEGMLGKEKQAFMLNKYSKEVVQKDIQDARNHGAEFVIVYNHWGREYWNEYTEKQALHAQEIADVGADLIIGSHPHALQTSDLLTTKDGKEVRVMYSMGNFVSHQDKSITKDTIILDVVLEKNSDGKVEISKIGYIPCHVLEEYNGDDYVVTPISSDFNNEIDESSLYYYELSNAHSRITSIINNTIPEITSYRDIQN